MKFFSAHSNLKAKYCKILFLRTLNIRSLVIDDVYGQPLSKVVDALEELPPEELDAHDGEDEPEHQAHQKDVEDAGDGVHQGVHDNLKGQLKIYFARI